MQTLKSKSLLFGYLVMLVLSFSMTSCGDDDILEEIEDIAVRTKSPDPASTTTVMPVTELETFINRVQVYNSPVQINYFPVTIAGMKSYKLLKRNPKAREFFSLIKDTETSNVLTPLKVTVDPDTKVVFNVEPASFEENPLKGK